jgi:small-conductance mechanosensitive channel
MEQIVVIAQGFARLAALVTAIVVAFAPFGLPSQDIASTARTAYFGFTIGGVTLSLSTLIAAAVVFVVGVAATRAAQNWLSDRYLPRTRLDPSVSHSIRAITGYAGLVIALMLAGGRLGLDMRQFTIVAGALSVGIGFGLQGIVNNFVAGLILLWERSIRVGDWVVVGSEQGFVRRMNARAIEIETFERSTLIVPNSTLVTTPVKNWILSDRVARVLVALNVDFSADPEKVRELLIASARSQELVLAIPTPLVVFKEIGDWALKFELICYVDDALIAYKVQSELNFDILRRLREAEVTIAAPYPRV